MNYSNKNPHPGPPATTRDWVRYKLIAVGPGLLFKERGAFVFALFALLAVNPIASAETTIKFATLAPEGSTWMKVMHEAAQEIDDKTKGQVKFRFYAGGVSGDERDVVRKIRIGQLHAAGFTGLG